MVSMSTPPPSKDELSLGSQESISPRWAENKPTGNERTNIHWAGVLRDDTLVAEFSTEDHNPKIMQMSRRFLKKKSASKDAPSASASTSTSDDEGPKIDWEFKTYAVQSQRRMVHAVKFFLYEKLPLEPGARARLHGLTKQAFLNNESVRVIEYNSKTGKYLIRPSIPTAEAQKLATTGMLIVDGKNLIATEQKVRVWTFAALYDGKRISQNVACQFIEKIILIVEGLKTMDEAWNVGGEMSCQEQFGPILKQQMEQFAAPENLALDSTLEYCNQVIQQNMKIVSGTASASCLYPV